MTEIHVHELQQLPTLAIGQAADLKIDTGTMRVWISRCGLADGETQPIQVERLIDGRWTDVTGSEDPHASSFKPHYLDGPYAGFVVTAITRRFVAVNGRTR